MLAVLYNRTMWRSRLGMLVHWKVYGGRSYR
jgi:hypothetical protein